MEKGPLGGTGGRDGVRCWVDMEQCCQRPSTQIARLGRMNQKRPTGNIQNRLSQLKSPTHMRVIPSLSYKPGSRNCSLRTVLPQAFVQNYTDRPVGPPWLDNFLRHASHFFKELTREQAFFQGQSIYSTHAYNLLL